MSTDSGCGERGGLDWISTTVTGNTTTPMHLASRKRYPRVEVERIRHWPPQPAHHVPQNGSVELRVTSLG